MKKWVVVFSMAICLLCSAVSFGDIIADSAADFSDAQGPNWFNGLYNQTTDPDGTFGVGDFQPFMEPDYAWNGSAWDFTGGNVPWTTIDATGGHPNGDNNGDVHYAVRRWVSNYDGSAIVDYNIAAQNLNGGDGTTAILYLNGTELSKTTVGGTDGVGQVVSQNLILASGDVLDLALSPQNVDGTFGDGSDGSLFGLTIFDEPPPPSQWETVWQLGAPGRDWRAPDGGVQFVQEAGVNDRPGDPNSPAENQQADDDYYTAGTYPDPIGTVGEELVMERAFAGADNRLTIHFNLPDNLNDEDKFRFSFNANNLHTGQGNSRYGAIVEANGTTIIPEVIYAENSESGLPVGTVTTSVEFTAADVGFAGGAGSDNEITLLGVNYNDDGGGNWMGMDYHHLEIMPIPEPGSLTMLLCGLFWAIPLVCWDKKKK